MRKIYLILTSLTISLFLCASCGDKNTTPDVPDIPEKPDVKPEPEPEPEPTPEERVAALEAENKTLKAQVSAQSDQMDFYEDCIAEMASVVYA